nr:DUF1010 domain-containing protein [Acidovorax sp. JG5]
MASSPCAASATSYHFASIAPPWWRNAFSRFAPVVNSEISVFASGSNFAVKPTCLRQAAYFRSLAPMSVRLQSPQSWRLWLVALLCMYCCYLLYAQALVIRMYIMPNVIANETFLVEHLFRMVGTFILACASFLGCLRKRRAILAAVFGAMVYLAPWIYNYASVVTVQSQSHLKWHMLKSYPMLSWQWFVFPCVAVLLIHIATSGNISDQKR